VDFSPLPVPFLPFWPFRLPLCLLPAAGMKTCLCFRHAGGRVLRHPSSAGYGRWYGLLTATLEAPTLPLSRWARAYSSHSSLLFLLWAEDVLDCCGFCYDRRTSAGLKARGAAGRGGRAGTFFYSTACGTLVPGSAAGTY